MKHHTEVVTSLAFSPDGKLLATGSEDLTTALVDTKTCEVRKSLVRPAFEGDVRSVAFSPDGKLLATGSRDLYNHVHNEASLVDTKTGEARHALRHHASFVTSVAFSPDGKLLATGSQDLTAALVDTETGEVRHTLTHHTDAGSCLTFSPDGKLPATGSWDRTVVLVDTETGEVRSRVAHHRGRVLRVAFSPCGMLLASGSYDCTAAPIWAQGTLWTREMHRYLPLASREAVMTVLLCALRIARRGERSAAQEVDGGGVRAPLPALPREMWLAILGLVPATGLLPREEEYNATRCDRFGVAAHYYCSKSRCEESACPF